MKHNLYLKKISGKGRGIFCREIIKKDTEFEICPVLEIPAKDYDTVKVSRLVDYFFNFNKEEQSLCLALGFGSLYNHAVYSNAAYTLNKENRTIAFYAVETINPGKEITINYGGERGLEFKEWFEARDLKIK